MHNAELETFLDWFYGSYEIRTNHRVEQYTRIYDLPIIQKDWQVNPFFFSRCKRIAGNFVIIATYNKKGQLLVVDSPTPLVALEDVISHQAASTEPTSKHLPTFPSGLGEVVGLRFLGGPINETDEESFEAAAFRIVQENASAIIVDLEPIANVTNTFHCNGDTIVHRGLAFLARFIGEPEFRKPYNIYHFTKDIPERMAFSNREVFIHAVKRIEEKFFDPPFEEIYEIERPVSVRLIHRYLFKPLTLRKGSRPLRTRILSHLENVKSILDVAAGDDDLVLDICADLTPHICVANDIAWKQMDPLRKQARRRALDVTFTNHNLSTLPYRMQFDVAICKNTLHHVPNKNELLAVLDRLKEVSKKLVFIEIMEPRNHKVSRIFHWYYENFYGDGARDHRFFTVESFHRLIELAFSDGRKPIFERVRTIRGLYIIAVIDLGKSPG